ncbi:MAG: PQQ-binding-like beta-propeller repeat protein [Planctomycetes bacterium]|nr:PQQ-binding-like beta-propeller repeat protein [Planctomycetota bacterium]
MPQHPCMPLRNSSQFVRRIRLRAGVVGTMLAVLLFSVRGPQPTAVAQKPPAQDADSDSSEDSSDEKPKAATMAMKRRVLSRMVYFRVGTQETLLQNAVRDLKAGRTNLGLRQDQMLLDSAADRFIWNPRPHGGTMTGLRRSVEQQLSQQNRNVLAAYERLSGPAAARLLREADQKDDAVLYRKVHLRYFFTAAGFTATDRLARLELDRGQPTAAAWLWSRLLNEPAHQQRVTTPLKFLTAYAFRKAGDRPRSDALLQEIGRQPVRIAGRLIDVNVWFAKNFPTRRSPTAASDWKLPLGNVSRNRSVPMTVLFPRPVWSVSYQQKGARNYDKVFRDWEKRQIGAGRPTAVANTAIVVGDSVIVRNFHGIQALRLSDGKPLWFYSGMTSLAQSLPSQLRTATPSRTNPFEPTRTVDSYAQLEHAYVGNSALGTLTSDGRYVFAIDGMQMKKPANPYRRRFRRRRNAEDPARRVNRLIALKIGSRDDHHPGRKTRSLKPVWTLGGAARDVGAKKTSGRLSDHFFLGPPLPANGKLYVLSESRRQLNLLCLKPDSGDVIWQQGLAYVEMPIERDHNRYFLSCSPAFANGVVVCPTQNGLLIGVDAATGSLLWAHFCGDDLQIRNSEPWAAARTFPQGHSGFWSLPRIQGNRVVYLPQQSSQLYCVDLKTGRELWRAARGDGEYVGAVSKDRVLVVGRRKTRGLSLESGKEIWSLPLGLPSGRGLCIGSRFLVPLASGQVATLEIASGRRIGQNPSWKLNTKVGGAVGADRNRADVNVVAFQPSSWRPGNLIVAGNYILSCEPQQMRAFPQASRVLAGVERALEKDPHSGRRHFAVAKVSFLLGRLTAAEKHLQTVLKSKPTNGIRRKAEHLLIEILYSRMAEEASRSAAFLERIGRLAKTPHERGRYLIHQAEFACRSNNFTAVLAATSEFAALDLKELFPLPGDPSLRVSAASWVPGILDRMRHRMGPAVRQTVSLQIDVAQQSSLAASGVEKLQQFLSVYADWPQAEAVRAELAERLIARGRFQHAELLLLTNRLSRHLRTRAVATEQLAGLWIRCGLHDRAAALLMELSGKYADIRLSDGKTTGRQFVSRFPENGSTRIALRRRQSPAVSVGRVRISEQRFSTADPKLVEAYSRYRQRFLLPSESSFDLLEHRTDNARAMTVVNRRTGVVAGKITIPLRHSYPTPSRHAHVGHFFPLGGVGSMYGVSLLEHRRGKPLWQTILPGAAYSTDMVQVGPAGPTFCTFQSRGMLTVVDPATGRVLWQRGDFSPEDGLISDPHSGLFGDEKVLVFFAEDRKNYTVYRTRTGEELRRGTIEISSNHVRRVIGRRLVFVSKIDGRQRLRVWDPLTNRDVLDIPFTGTLQSTATSTGELVVLLPPNRLLVFDVPRGKVRLDRRLDRRLNPADAANVVFLRAFRIGDRLFVNLQRAGGLANLPRAGFLVVSPGRTIASYASDSFVPAMHLNGDLHAFDLKSGKRLWTRRLPQTSMLQLQRMNIPFLILLSRMRGKRLGGRQSLYVEVIDSETGQTLARKDNVFPDRILNVAFDPDRRRITLQGMKTTIHIDALRRRVRRREDPNRF